MAPSGSTAAVEPCAVDKAVPVCTDPAQLDIVVCMAVAAHAGKAAAEPQDESQGAAAAAPSEALVGIVVPTSVFEAWQVRQGIPDFSHGLFDFAVAEHVVAMERAEGRVAARSGNLVVAAGMTVTIALVVSHSHSANVA